MASLTAANEVLRHKLEAQTQRMELAVQQAMLHGSVPVLPDGPGNGRSDAASAGVCGGVAMFVLPTELCDTGRVNGVAAPTPMSTPAKGVPTTPRRGVVGWMFGR